MKKSLIYILFTLTTIIVAYGQQITLPYDCGFEPIDDVSNWHLNEGTPQASDKWCIGTAERNDGRYSLYISSDGGSTASFSGRPNITMAYLKFRFPQSTKREEYQISFDWKCEGMSMKSALYAYITAESQISNIPISETNGILDNNFISQCKSVTDYPNVYMSGTRLWQSVSFSVPFAVGATQSAYDYVLVFIWASGASTEDEVKGKLSACIDNIQISSNLAKRPTNLVVESNCADSALVLSWESPLSNFVVEYKNVNASYWRVISGIQSSGLQHSYSIDQLNEGAYYLRVRGIRKGEDGDDDIIGAYTTSRQVALYCPENHCINFADLKGPNTTCTYGTFKDVYQNIGVVDYGFESAESRHTVHWEQGVYDPRTENKLLTVPPGATASVRLGNWLSGGEGESITYDFIADTVSQAILLLKYAVVLEQPGHDREEQPFFSLEVLDEHGDLISPDCGYANFYAGYGDGEWHNVYAEGSNTPKLVWKDWTTIGVYINSEHHGKNLQVRLITRDCALSGHYGYAYFTLDCLSATLSTNNCGSDARIEVNAPEGFTYRWYDDIGRELGNNQELIVDADKHIYYCEACYKEMDNCCFTLSTSMAPRFPVADFDWNWQPAKCKNQMQFINKSHVMTVDNGIENHTTQQCEGYEWVFSNGFQTSVPSPMVTFAATGDTVQATLRAILAAGACDTIITKTVVVPSILTPDHNTHEEKCEGDAVFFDNDWRNKTGFYTEYNKNIYGCDSLVNMELVIHPLSPETYIVDTTCSNLPYIFGGKNLNQSGEDYQYWAKNVWGCDSIVHLNLTVVEHLELAVEELPTICQDVSYLAINYGVFAGAFDSLYIRFSDKALLQGFDNRIIYDNSKTSHIYTLKDNIVPDFYSVELTFFQQGCEEQVFTLPFEVRYSSAIIEQKWNDVLYVKNASYNGGYTFSAYQWFKNGMPIDGATKSYIYTTSGDLDQDAEYSVMLSRSDGSQVLTCPFVPITKTDIYEFPTLLDAGQKVRARMPQAVTAYFYDALGRLVQTTQLYSGYNEIQAPTIPGHYVVQLLGQDSQKTYKVFVR